ncbi:MAG: divalent-cation tolerance protein CutA [Candidatus Competibacterales bacterium]|nr:divalent-cation tolerance protein CutA [Candidatus Competibacterales bacterium]
MTHPEFCLVMTTCADRAAAELLAGALLERQLAACIQLLECHSFFRWEGAVQSEPEVLLFIKTRTASYRLLEAAVRELHDYEVPELVQVPIETGLSGYLDWIREQTVTP